MLLMRHCAGSESGSQPFFNATVVPGVAPAETPHRCQPTTCSIRLTPNARQRSSSAELGNA